MTWMSVFEAVLVSAGLVVAVCVVWVVATVLAVWWEDPWPDVAVLLVLLSVAVLVVAVGVEVSSS